jgi:hypothetical protein
MASRKNITAAKIGLQSHGSIHSAAQCGSGKPQDSLSAPSAIAQRPAAKRTSESADVAGRPSFRTAPGRGAPDFRALTVFESLPPGHQTFRVREDGSEPHLREGEYAVVDSTDRELQHGELYVIQYEGGRRSRHISQATSDHLRIGSDAEPSLVWFMRDLRGFRRTDEAVEGIPVFAGMSDGPYTTDHLQSKLIGRVVGVAFSTLGDLLAPAAGWENEEEGNAAFDPSEYIETLLGAGYRPYVLRGSSQEWGYYEHFPTRRQTRAKEKAVTAVLYKFGAASTALDRVIEECVRRGLVT